MNVVGVDLSLTATGVADSSGAYTLKSKPMQDRFQRYQNIWRDLRRHLNDGDIVVLEAYSSHLKGNAQFLWEFGGVIRWFLREQGFVWAEISPATLKRFATGRGNADKIAMAVSASKRAGLEFKTDNECDAFWLMAAGYDWYGQPVISLPEAHREALRSVDWPDLNGRRYGKA